MADIDIERPAGRRQYKSVQKHHHTSRKRNAGKWQNRNKETRTFDAADYGNHTNTPGNDSWEDNERNLWGFLENFEVVGTKKEQFGYFPKTTNDIDSWHGYPVIPYTEEKYVISEELVHRWINEGYLTANDVGDLRLGRRL